MIGILLLFVYCITMVRAVHQLNVMAVHQLNKQTGVYTIGDVVQRGPPHSMLTQTHAPGGVMRALLTGYPMPLAEFQPPVLEGINVGDTEEIDTEPVFTIHCAARGGGRDKI